MNIFILRSAMSSLESCNDVIRYYNVREKRQNVASLQICEDQWILFQENSMFKQFFGACNQLDWFVSEILISAKADRKILIEKRGRVRIRGSVGDLGKTFLFLTYDRVWSGQCEPAPRRRGWRGRKKPDRRLRREFPESEISENPSRWNKLLSSHHLPTQETLVLFLIQS